MLKSTKHSGSDITTLIYVHNDDVNIQRAILSAKLLTHHIVILDIGSTDNTVKIAEESGARVIKTAHKPYVELVRMAGIKQVKTDWVFILDSDEVITQELADEINELVANGELRFTSYKVPRKNIFGKNKWLKHGGWWPDHQTRLIHIPHLESWPSMIHSTPVIKGETGLLKNPLVHYSHGNFSSMIEKTITFEDIESDLLYKAHRRVSVPIFFRKFLGELYRRLIKNKGFLDGKEGIAESLYQAYSKTITYLMLYEKEKSSSL